MLMESDRFDRQRGLIPQDRLEWVSASVIGVGAIGRQVAVQLASIGIRQLQLLDFDRVEAVNVTCQGYLAADIGQAKVTATANTLLQIDPTIEVVTIEDRFRSRYELCQAVFCCVDSIASRTAIWRAAGNRAPFWADGRMLGEVMRVLVVSEDRGRQRYPATLFAPAEAHIGSCTSRSTIYTASIAAGLMLHQFTRWLRALPTDADTSLNLLSGDMTIA